MRVMYEVVAGQARQALNVEKTVQSSRLMLPSATAAAWPLSAVGVQTRSRMMPSQGVASTRASRAWGEDAVARPDLITAETQRLTGIFRRHRALASPSSMLSLRSAKLSVRCRARLLTFSPALTPGASHCATSLQLPMCSWP